MAYAQLQYNIKQKINKIGKVAKYFNVSERMRDDGGQGGSTFDEEKLFAWQSLYFQRICQ